MAISISLAYLLSVLTLRYASVAKAMNFLLMEKDCPLSGALKVFSATNLLIILTRLSYYYDIIHIIIKTIIFLIFKIIKISIK